MLEVRYGAVDDLENWEFCETEVEQISWAISFRSTECADYALDRLKSAVAPFGM